MKPRIRKMLAVGAVLLGGVAGALAVASPAAAYPSGCSKTVGSSFGVVQCTGGDGVIQARVYCYTYNGGLTPTHWYFNYGPLASVPGSSLANCSANGIAVYVQYQVNLAGSWL